MFQISMDPSTGHKLRGFISAIIVYGIWFRLCHAKIGPDSRQICNEAGVFFRTNSFRQWTMVQRTYSVSKLNSNLELFKKGLLAVQEQAVNMSVKIDSATGAKLPPEFDMEGSWNYLEQDDILIEIDSILPKGLQAKCKEHRAYLLTLGQSDDTTAALQSLSASASTAGIKKLVFDAAYTREGVVDRASGRVVLLFGGTNGITYDGSADMVNKYGPLVYDIASSTFSAGETAAVEITKTWCVKPTADYALSQQHQAVSRSAFIKLQSVVEQFVTWITSIQGMIQATPLISSIIPDEDVAVGVKSTWGLDQFIPLILKLKDSNFYTRQTGSPIDEIREFSGLVEDFLRNNIIINIEQREFVLRVTKSRIPPIVGTTKSIPLPYLKVKLIQRHPSDVLKMQVSYIRSIKTAVYAVHAYLHDGNRLDLDVLVHSDEQTFLAHEAPSTNCLTLANEKVCDIMVPSSANFQCAQYLFGEPQEGHLKDHCPMRKRARDLYIIPDVICINTPKPTTIVVSAKQIQLNLVCHETNEKVAMGINANSQSKIPEAYAKCAIRGPDGNLIRRSDSHVSNLLVAPFELNDAIVHPHSSPATTTSTTTTPTTNVVVEVDDDNKINGNQVKELRDDDMSQINYLTIAVTILGAILCKLIVIILCCLIKGCRLYFYHTLCCCKDNCAICTEAHTDEPGNQHELEPLSRQSRRSSIADEFSGRLRHLLEETAQPESGPTTEVALREAIMRDRTPASTSKVSDEQIQNLLKLGHDLAQSKRTQTKKGRNSK